MRTIVNDLPTVKDCLTAALRRVNRQSAAWKGFTGIFEFVLSSGDHEPTISHFTFGADGATWKSGPSPLMPSAKVTIDESNFVLLAKSIIDEELARRRGILKIEGDMYVVHKLPSLLVTDMPLC
jgi:hypothetical protein